MATTDIYRSSKGGPADKLAGFAQAAERHRRRGHLERAVELCEQGLELFPEHLSGRVTFGWALLDLGRYEQAQTELEAVLKRAPDNLSAIRGLAELHDRAESTLPLGMETPEDWPAAEETEGFDAAAFAAQQEDDEPESEEPVDLAGLIDAATEAPTAPNVEAEVLDEVTVSGVPDSDLVAAADVMGGNDAISEDLDLPDPAAIAEPLDDLDLVLESLQAEPPEDGPAQPASPVGDVIADHDPIDPGDEVGLESLASELALTQSAEPSEELEGLYSDRPEAVEIADQDPIDPGDEVGLEALASELAVVQSAEPSEELEGLYSERPEEVELDAEPAVDEAEDLSDAVAAFAQTAEDADESPHAVLTAAAASDEEEATVSADLSPALVDESADLLEGHADAENLADHLAAFADFEPALPDGPDSGAEDLREAPSLADAADLVAGAGDDQDPTADLTLFESAESLAAVEHPSQIIASAELETDDGNWEMSLADHDNPLVGGEHVAPEFESAETTLADGGQDEAPDASDFDVLAEIGTTDDALDFEGYARLHTGDDEGPDADHGFDAAREAADIMAAEADSAHAELVAEIAAVSAMDAADPGDVHEPPPAAELPTELDAAPAEWTPPVPASEAPSHTPPAEDQDSDFAAPFAVDEGHDFAAELASELTAQAAFTRPAEFDATAVVRTEAVDALPGLATEVGVSEHSGVADVLRQTPLLRLEQMLGRVQARRLRQAVESVA